MVLQRIQGILSREPACLVQTPAKVSSLIFILSSLKIKCRIQTARSFKNNGEFVLFVFLHMVQPIGDISEKQYNLKPVIKILKQGDVFMYSGYLTLGPLYTF